MKSIIYSFLIILSLFCFCVVPVFAENGEITERAARIGTGVGIGTFHVEEDLLPGGVYKLRSLPVINTGLSEGNFEVSAALKEGPALANSAGVSNWFSFQPASFRLEPEEVGDSKVSLSLPFDAPPGEYLVYLEATQTRNPSGEVTLSPSAAAKLYFTVAPASVLGAYRARFLTFLELNPKVYLIIAAILLIEAGFVLRRHFNFQIRVEKKQ